MNAPTVSTPTAPAPAAAPAVTPARARPELPAGATYLPDGSVSVTLDYPVTQHTLVNGVENSDTVATIIMHRIKGRAMTDILDLKGDGSQSRAMIEAAMRMTGPVAAMLLDEVDAEDYIKLTQVAAVFFGSGKKKTGRSTSPQ